TWQDKSRCPLSEAKRTCRDRRGVSVPFLRVERRPNFAFACSQGYNRLYLRNCRDRWDCRAGKAGWRAGRCREAVGGREGLFVSWSQPMLYRRCSEQWQRTAQLSPLSTFSSPTPFRWDRRPAFPPNTHPPPPLPPFITTRPWTT